MPKICPCQDDMEKDTFIFAILIIDIALLTFFERGWALLPLIGMFIYLRAKNWDSGYFNFYAWFRLIMTFVSILVIIIVIIALSLAINVEQYIAEDYKKYMIVTNMIVFVLLALPWVMWDLYLSFQLLFAVKEIQKCEDDINKGLKQDEENPQEQTMSNAQKENSQKEQEVDLQFIKIKQFLLKFFIQLYRRESKIHFEIKFQDLYRKL